MILDTFCSYYQNLEDKIFGTTVVASSCDPYQKYTGDGMVDCIEHCHGAKEMGDRVLFSTRADIGLNSTGCVKSLGSLYF